MPWTCPCSCKTTPRRPAVPRWCSAKRRWGKLAFVLHRVFHWRRPDPQPFALCRRHGQRGGPRTVHGFRSRRPSSPIDRTCFAVHPGGATGRGADAMRRSCGPNPRCGTSLRTWSSVVRRVRTRYRISASGARNPSWTCTRSLSTVGCHAMWLNRITEGCSRGVRKDGSRGHRVPEHHAWNDRNGRSNHRCGKSAALSSLPDGVIAQSSVR
jgi:hypothetical protein